MPFALHMHPGKALNIFFAILLWIAASGNAPAAPFIDPGEAPPRAPGSRGDSPGFKPLPMTGSGPKNPYAPQVPDTRTPGRKASLTAPARNSTTTPLQAAPAVPASRNASAGRTEPTLSDMIGQMIMIGMKGFELRDADPLLAGIRAGRAGNILLFERDALGGPKNIESPAQLRLLTARLQKAAPRPLCIAVDQEGGKVQRLRPERGFEGGPAAAVLGNGSPDATRQAARRMGLEMAAVGITMNFAPVADLNINPLNPAIGAMQRSFGANPHLAAAHAIAFGEGMIQAGVAPCLKHFPGHGSAREDSHDSLPDITASWQPTELIPFQKAILEGWAGAVMPGHLYHRGLDALRPASLSARVLNGLLRGTMGFTGVIVSDDLQMGAVAKAYSLEDRILLAVEAGVDILVFGNNSRMPELSADKIHAVLLRLVQQGRISPARIAASFVRISRLKQRFAGWKP